MASKHKGWFNMKLIRLIVRLLILLALPVLFKLNFSKVNATAVIQATPPSTIRLSTTPDWVSQDREEAYSVSWGDIENDGDLDLVVSGYSALKIYFTEDGVLKAQPGWRTPSVSNAYSLVLGDVDNNGYLDLVIPNRVYYNENGKVSSIPIQFAENNDATASIALGDVDGDGDLDLAVGNRPSRDSECGCYRDDGRNKVYLNENGRFQSMATWLSDTSDVTTSVAWGDVDGDGDLDLAVGNRTNAPNKVYRNNSGALESTHVWTSTMTAYTQSIAWGDVDGDGDLDLASAGDGENYLYLNTGSNLLEEPILLSQDTLDTSIIVWGDLDSDGDLDLIAGNRSNDSQPVGNKVYINVNGVLRDADSWTSTDISWAISVALADYDSDGDLDLASAGLHGVGIYNNQRTVMHTTKVWTSQYEDDRTRSLAWGDVDNDGYLDLAVANGGPDTLYLNIGGTLQITPTWISDDPEDSWDIAWGDVDGDGDLDLAVAGGWSSNKLYVNDNGRLNATPEWQSLYQETQTTTIAWGDVDGDGDLDLAFGGHPVGIYMNHDGLLDTMPVIIEDRGNSNDIAWGDVDNDGDLDLAVAQYPGGRIYRNEGGILKTIIWRTTIEEHTNSIAWGDVDGDGDLDLALGNDEANTLYLNENGQLAAVPAWYSIDTYATYSLAWGDADGDGDLDLAAGNVDDGSGSGSVNILYLNENGKLQLKPRLISDTLCQSEPDCFNFTESVAWGDVDNDGDFDLAIGRHEPNNVLYNQQNGQFSYPDNELTIAIDRYSITTTIDADQPITILATADHYAIPQIRQEVIPIHFWLFQQNGEPAREVRAYYSVNGGDHWQEALPATNTILTDLATDPYPTRSERNKHTFYWDVSASGFFGQSDNVVVRIVALPNLKPMPNAVAGSYQYPAATAHTYPFRVRGTQIRVINEAGLPVNGAMVSRLRPDGATPSQLIGNGGIPARTSALGYLQGRGELKAGDQLLAMNPITVTEKYTLYNISASSTVTGVNAYTVNAGGVQTLTVSTANPLLLFDLKVSLEWDASNDPVFLQQLEQNLLATSSSLYDWSNGQVALGNVTIYQDREHWADADIHIFASNQLRPTASRGGVVTATTVLTDVRLTEPITVAPGNVHIGAVWSRYGDPNNLGGDWSNVLAHELAHYLLFLEDTYLKIDPTTGRLVAHNDCRGTAMSDPYDELGSELRYGDESWELECGPSLAELPEWELMKIAYRALQVPKVPNPGPSYMPFALTRVQSKAPQSAGKPLRIDPNVALGDAADELVGGRAYLLRRSVAGLNQQILDLGRPIQQSITVRGAREGDELCIFGRKRYLCTLLHSQSQPAINLQNLWEPAITLSPVNTNTLTIQVSGTPGTPYTVTFYPDGATPQTAIIQAGVVQTVTLQNAAVNILVDVMGSGQGERLITGYSIGSGPARLHSFDGPARLHSFDGPVASGDGSVVIFPPDDLPKDAFIALQVATSPPNLLPGLISVGRAYYLRPSTELADWATGSVTFQYLGLDVLLTGVPEENLVVYFIGASGLQQLPTDLNPKQNFVSAPLAGPGLYVLATGYHQTLYGPGWNDISYPASLASQPITQALASLGNRYSLIYGCDPTQSNDPWKVYAPSAPAWVNDLTQMEPQRVYKIHVTESVTWTVGSTNAVASMTNPCSQNPPATFYGELGGVTPDTQITVTAKTNGNICGQGTAQNINGQLVFAINVAADTVDSTSRCGRIDMPVSFEVNGAPLSIQANWDNRYAQSLGVIAIPSLQGSPIGNGSQQNQLYLPLVTNN